MTPEIFLGGKVVLHAGDSRTVLKTLAASSIDSIVTDPPYALVSIVNRYGKTRSNMHEPAGTKPHGSPQYQRLAKGFMGKDWDNGDTAFAAEFWAECLRVLKPGGHVVAFSGTRTYHRMACAIEDAGFEVRDMLSWLYGSGFPKSHDVSKGMDKTAGHWRGRAGEITIKEQSAKGTEYERTDKGEPITASALQWQGWGTALKPACEPICFGRKPLIGTVAANVLAHGTGAINVDGCRVGTDENLNGGAYSGGAKILANATSYATGVNAGEYNQPSGRWPANVLHDGSAEVLAGFPESKDGVAVGGKGNAASIYGTNLDKTVAGDQGYGGEGSAARFFYTSKADSDDRLGSKHPTVKPLDLMQWLCRLVTPPGGTILDPFSGTGTTGEAAFREGFNAVLIEREEEYQNDIRRRMRLVMGGPDERARESIKARQGDALPDHGPLFAEAST